MVSLPRTNPPGTPPQADGDLDWRREASMADEGGWSAALVETEETAAPPVGEPPPPEEESPFRGSGPPRRGPRRLWSSVALRAAAAIAKLTARARRYAAGRAHARSHGQSPTSSH